jgi:DNA-binding MarR family transcriptional regulator
MVMNIDKVITRFATMPHDPVELRRVARALGSELRREELDTLERFRAELAQTPLSCDGADSTDSSSYAAGYVASMLDITSEYETHLRHSVDKRELEDLVVREGWRELLLLLCEGPKLPSELADTLGQERSTVTRTLKKLRVAGLVRVHPGTTTDGRKRPHRLTLEGERIVARLNAGLPDDVARGIRVAVGMFRHLLAYPSDSPAVFDEVAGQLLGDPDMAPEAVAAWRQECARVNLPTSTAASAHTSDQTNAQAGAANAALRDDLVADFDTDIGSESDYSNGIPLPILAKGSLSALRSDALWHTAHELLGQLNEQDTEPLPVFVRTSDQSWGAWAYALDQSLMGGRAIVDGDLMSRSVQPPEQRFVLLYDDPHTIRSDRDKPTMQAFMQRAACKFVVTQPGDNPDDVPEDFTLLPLTRAG